MYQKHHSTAQMTEPHCTL